VAKRVLATAGVDTFEELPRWKASAKTQRAAFTREQLDEIARHTDHPVFGLFVVSLNTGLSLVDVCRLQWSCVDLDGGWIRTTRAKTGATLSIPILPPLRDYLSQRTVGQFVFPDWEQQYREGRAKVSRQVQDFLKYTCQFETTDRSGDGRGKMVLGFHSCRHTFAYLAEAAGVPLSVIQSIVGHFSPEMTQRYLAHAQEGVIQDAVRVLTDPSPRATDLSGVSDAELLAEIKRRDLGVELIETLLD
jgi:integrase